MHPSIRLSASARVHKPLINFIGKRKWPSTPERPHAHPAAPAEFKASFTTNFLKKFEASASPASKPAAAASSGKSSGVNVSSVETYTEFWDAPSRYWNPKIRELEEREIDAISTGGASLR
ncbi:hypothetical protein JAAARDRAFT_28781 [Jaapia argillacea MUCL 33604]|uniref:Uncharacterized protein n=1 Tax=Jaapia argillacea MUCL 33604 TaxID=933084 RepID=A0A067QNI5_9AGAM|nr:hypothetical protein JAAARDRAFT_28781 [Jaapia argillacea MUCL 33604]